MEYWNDGLIGRKKSLLSVFNTHDSNIATFHDSMWIAKSIETTNRINDFNIPGRSIVKGSDGIRKEGVYVVLL